MTTNIRLLTFAFLLGLSCSNNGMYMLFKKPEPPLIYQLGAQAKKALKENYGAIALASGKRMLLTVPPLFLALNYQQRTNYRPVEYSAANKITTNERVVQGAKAVLFSLGAAGVQLGVSKVIDSYLAKNSKSLALNLVGTSLRHLSWGVTTEYMGRPAALAAVSCATGVKPSVIDQCFENTMRSIIYSLIQRVIG